MDFKNISINPNVIDVSIETILLILKNSMSEKQSIGRKFYIKRCVNHPVFWINYQNYIELLNGAYKKVLFIDDLNIPL